MRNFNEIFKKDGIYDKIKSHKKNQGFTLSLEDTAFQKPQGWSTAVVLGLNKIKDKSVTHSIFRRQDNESVMCGFCCIAFT